jgi:hypothetical protein
LRTEPAGRLYLIIITLIPVPTVVSNCGQSRRGFRSNQVLIGSNIISVFILQAARAKLDYSSQYYAHFFAVSVSGRTLISEPA